MVETVVALTREQLDDNDVGQIPQEVEAGQRPEWRDIDNRNLISTSCWAQWNSLLVRDGVLEFHWESPRRNEEDSLNSPSTE
jgi:hypothetical protein